MSSNIIEDETGRPIRKVDDELSEGDFVITQSPAVIDEDHYNMPTVEIHLDQIRDIEGDYVYLRKGRKVPKFRIVHVVRNGKPVNYSGCDRMRMCQEDDKVCRQ